MLVSIVTPCFNASKFISIAIESVLSQTYSQWELIIVDDCSTDKSAEIINAYSQNDSRIRYFKTTNNTGSATLPRNIGIENAAGEYIAFLDSDDVWLPTKLEKQLRLAKETGAALVYSYYEKIDQKGVRDNRLIKSPSSVTYAQLLSGNVIGCLTAMYSVSKVGKFYFKQVGHEDFALWLDILRNDKIAYSVPEVLALYRVGRKSLSSNKFEAFKWTWSIYRTVEQLSLLKSIYLFVQYALKAIIKYVI